MKSLLNKTKILSFAFLFSIFPLTLTAQQLDPTQIKREQGTLSFFLTDSENGYGVEGTVLLQGPRGSYELSTTEGGKLIFSGVPGKYEITLLANGYDNLSTYFIIESGKTINVDAILEKGSRIPVLYKKYVAPIVEGYVIEQETGKPLAGVSVQLTQEGLTVTTDSQGFFSMKPARYSTINSPEDKAVRSDFKFSKNGFISHTVENLLMVPDKIKLKIYLEKGQGENTEKYHQNVLDGTAEDVQMYEDAAPKEDESNYKSNEYEYRSTCSIPSSIRVGRNCNCTVCSNVTVMSLQYYSESGLDDEWISSWGIESLKAGSIPYRTYGGYYVNNPVKPNFDIASSTCNQVWGATVYTNSQSAAQTTSGKILILNGTNPVRSEYSAENNYGGTSYNCSNGYAGGSGAYSCHSDNVCVGKSPAGHGRGMCQWGSQRWATSNSKTYTWIINHYYTSTIGYTLCGLPAPLPPPTNLAVTQKPDCSKGAIFTWTNSASNWTIQISTSSNFSNPSNKTVAAGTTTTAPSGFSPAINWQNNTTYYWRISYGNILTNGPSFIYKCDVIKPTTSITVPGANWKTTDFTANFTDTDEAGGSGLAKSFYQILYYDGSAWKANPNRGFFGDNFDAATIGAPWTVQSGAWGISTDNKLQQTGITAMNSNIRAPLDQNLSNRYLYVWNGKIGGTGTDKRAGLHFFCDNAAQTERGNSYLVNFKSNGNTDPNNNNKVQIYKSVGNVLSLKKTVSYTINANQWYEFSIAYDRVTGEMIVYVDGNVAARWTDPTPLSSGNAVSFRNGNSVYQIDNFKVYRTRYPSVTVSVGPGTNTDIPFQNTSPTTPAAKVKSIVMDNAGNLSAIAQEFINVDWTKPRDLIVKDGLAADIDTVFTNTLQANWGTTNDPQSGIVEYKYAIGTTAAGSNVIAWTTNGTNTSFSNILPALNYGQVYYVTVVAKNAAGIKDTSSSDGQRYVQNPLSVNEDVLNAIEMFPNPTVNELYFNNLTSEAGVFIYDMTGKLILTKKVNSNDNIVNVSAFAVGSYNVMIKMDDRFVLRKLIKK